MAKNVRRACTVCGAEEHKEGYDGSVQSPYCSIECERAGAVRQQREREAFEAGAKANALNVIENRVRKFFDANSDEIRELVRRWAFMYGLTTFDIDQILERLRGNPKPIEVAPEPPEEDEDLWAV